MKSAVQLPGGAFAVHSLCLPAFSSVSFGRVTRTVTDQSGVVVSGVSVSVMNTEKGVTRTLTTDDAGVYNAPNLTASNYSVRLEAPRGSRGSSVRASAWRWATKLGIVRELVSRNHRQLQVEGCLEVNGRTIIVKDLVGLRREQSSSK